MQDLSLKGDHHMFYSEVIANRKGKKGRKKHTRA